MKMSVVVLLFVRKIYFYKNKPLPTQLQTTANVIDEL